MYQFLASGTISSGQLLLPDGSVSAPAASFASETNTGIFRGAGSTISFAVAGVTRAQLQVATFTVGGSGLGFINAGVTVTANTGTASPTLPVSGTLYTNTGDADGSIVTLPNDPTAGAVYEFAVRVAQTMTINVSAGETIQDAAASGTSTASNTIGSTMRLVAITGGSGAVWQVMSKTGVWVTT